MASLKHPKSSTPRTPRTSTLRNAFPIGESAVKPQKTRVTLFVASSRCIRTNASADDISTPATSDKSSTRNWIGWSSQDFPSRRFRIVSSTYVIVPKKRKPERVGIRLRLTPKSYDIPCNRRIVVCLDTSRIYARWRLGRRTADIERSPVYMARILRSWEFWTTKKKPKKTSWDMGGLSEKGIRTTNDNTKQNPNNEVPNRHCNHNTDYSDIFRPIVTRSVTWISGNVNRSDWPGNAMSVIP